MKKRVAGLSEFEFEKLDDDTSMHCVLGINGSLSFLYVGSFMDL